MHRRTDSGCGEVELSIYYRGLRTGTNRAALVPLERNSEGADGMVGIAGHTGKRPGLRVTDSGELQQITRCRHQLGPKVSCSLRMVSIVSIASYLLFFSRARQG